MDTIVFNHELNHIWHIMPSSFQGVRREGGGLDFVIAIIHMGISCTEQLWLAIFGARIFYVFNVWSFLYICYFFCSRLYFVLYFDNLC